MTLRYFLRRHDPLCPVYAVDFEAGTWRLAASKIGASEICSGTLTKRSDKDFPADRFVEVWPQPSDDLLGIAAYTLEKPEEGSGKRHDG